MTGDGDRDFQRATLRTKRSLFVVTLVVGSITFGSLAAAAWSSGRQWMAALLALIAVWPSVISVRAIRRVDDELAQLERVRVAHR